MEVLRNKVLIEGTMTAANQWRYFNFTCTTYTFGISMREYSVGHNDSFLYLMIAENRFPTLRYSKIMIIH
jgi:hypothetical protein